MFIIFLPLFGNKHREKLEVLLFVIIVRAQTHFKNIAWYWRGFLFIFIKLSLDHLRKKKVTYIIRKVEYGNLNLYVFLVPGVPTFDSS